ncbi:MAG: hypothetical protein KBF17_12155 [Candidatus Promineofilum sp.]|nr:hypothetical protein [Promineifilum sp.]MBP9657015.1 hypothetical protein [Promineifilum sp.]
MTNEQVDLGSRTFLAVANRRVVRATCCNDGSWQVATVLDGPSPVTLAGDPNHPDVVYAGTQGNGVYRSADRGRNWASLGMAGRIVKSLAVSPHDPDVIYAGVKPALVYKTNDGGQHWVELEGFRRVPNRWWWFSPAEPPFRAYVNALAVSPAEPYVVLAGIEFGAVVRSEDGGRTWSRHRPGAMRDCHSLGFHHRDGRWVYEAGGTGGGAAVSRDGGRTWKQPKSGLAKKYGVVCAADPARPEVWYVAVAPGPGKAYGENAEAYLYRASAGADWQPIGWEPQPMRRMPRALVTLPDAPGQLFVGTTYGDVWHTADYGDSWQRLPFDLGGGLSLLVL